MNDRMILGKAAFPAYLKNSDELPQPVQDVQFWSENYLTQAYDPVSGVGLYFHFSRTPFNPNIWEGVFTCYLPGNRLLVARDFSWADNVKGPGSNAFRFELIKPFEQWSECFRGAAQLVTDEQIHAGPLQDSAHVFADVDVTFNAIAPVFDVGEEMGKETGSKSWGRAHYEQFGEISGRISFDATCLGQGTETYQFKGRGIRDHSLGPRNLVPMGNHVWISGEFPSGRVFMVLDVNAKIGHPFTYCVVGDKAGFFKVKLSKQVCIDKLSQRLDPYELHLEGADGKPIVIKAEVLRTMPYSFIGPNEWCLGNHPKAHHVDFESPTRFEWDGEIGYGNTERTII